MKKALMIFCLLFTFMTIVIFFPACNGEVTSHSPGGEAHVQPTQSDEQFWGSYPPSPTSMGKGITFAGRWQYDFPQIYDPEIGFFDAITITSTSIKGKDYLILSFDPLSGPNNSRFFIFAVENPLSPRLVSTISPEQRGRDMFLVRSTAVQKNILFSSLFVDKGLWMVDISNPTEPRDLGIAPIEVTSHLIVQGTYAIASGQMYNGISISDISDPQNAGEVSRIDIPSRDCRLAISGHYLFIGIQQTLTIVDISTPAAPKTLCNYELEVPDDLSTQLPAPTPGQIHWGSWASIIDLQADGDYLYVTFGAGQLRVIDVSDPLNSREVRSVDIGGFAIAITQKDNRLYVTKSDPENPLLGLSILDISQPDNPELLDSVETQSIFGFGGATFGYCWARPQVVGSYIYVAGLSYMDIFRIR